MKRLWAPAVILLAAILILFVLSVPRTRDVLEQDRSGELRASPQVKLRSSYNRGVHTLTGSVRAPNACAPVAAEASMTGEPPSAIRLALTMPEAEGICLEIPTDIPFSVKITAAQGLPIQVTVNGEVAATTP